MENYKNNKHTKNHNQKKSTFHFQANITKNLLSKENSPKISLKLLDYDVF